MLGWLISQDGSFGASSPDTSLGIDSALWQADLRAALDQMPRRVRAELLRALRLQSEALDEEIGRRESDPRTQVWAAMRGSFGTNLWRG